MIEDKFAYTTEGYKEAKKWLKKMGYWEEISKKGNGFSTDGWSITQVANDRYRKYWEQEAEKCKDNPYYFYTNYVVTIDEDGNEIPATTHLSEKEFNEMVENYTWE